MYLVRLVKIYSSSLLPFLIDLVNKDYHRYVWRFISTGLRYGPHGNRKLLF